MRKLYEAARHLKRMELRSERRAALEDDDTAEA
jgi:hypothetical protein